MLFIQTAIANAKTLEEVERLNNMLKTGQIPGKETKKPKCKFTFHFIISFFFRFSRGLDIFKLLESSIFLKLSFYKKSEYFSFF